MCSFALFILALSADPDGSGPSVGGPPSSKESKGDNRGQGMLPSTMDVMDTPQLCVWGGWGVCVCGCVRVGVCVRVCVCVTIVHHKWP